MADIKWIKIVTDIFDDEKILLIESLPEADSIIVIWFKLLCLAGKVNNSGVFMMNDKIPYTDKMLATIFRRKESTVQLALQTFENFGMVEIIDGVITIPNWGKHQSLDQLEKKRASQKEYMRQYREKQKLISCKTNSKANVSRPEEEIEEEIELDKIRRDNITSSIEDVSAPPAEKISYQSVVDLYNSICVSFPKVKKLSEARKKAIRARLNTYTLDDFKRLFEMAEESYFLKGGNNRNWSASFDWMIADANMAKVLDGNYTDSKKPAPSRGYKRTEIVHGYIQDDLDRAERIMNGRSKSDDP